MTRLLRNLAVMSENPHTRIITPMPAELIGRIDDYRFAHRAASRSDAIRRLIELGLARDSGFKMSDEMAERVTKIRLANGIASESKAIRDMLEYGLAAAERALERKAKAKPD
jgi:metal-responsive CopG/Arc/MetJ family transcriptional regulator